MKKLLLFLTVLVASGSLPFAAKALDIPEHLYWKGYDSPWYTSKTLANTVEWEINYYPAVKKFVYGDQYGMATLNKKVNTSCQRVLASDGVNWWGLPSSNTKADFTNPIEIGPQTTSLSYCYPSVLYDNTWVVYDFSGDVATLMVYGENPVTEEWGEGTLGTYPKGANDKELTAGIPEHLYWKGYRIKGFNNASVTSQGFEALEINYYPDVKKFVYGDMDGITTLVSTSATNTLTRLVNASDGKCFYSPTAINSKWNAAEPVAVTAKTNFQNLQLANDINPAWVVWDFSGDEYTVMVYDKNPVNDAWGEGTLGTYSTGGINNPGVGDENIPAALYAKGIDADERGDAEVEECPLAFYADQKAFVYGGAKGDANLASDDEWDRAIKIATGDTWLRPVGVQPEEGIKSYLEFDKVYDLELTETWGATLLMNEAKAGWWVVDFSGETPTLTISSTRPDYVEGPVAYDVPSVLYYKGYDADEKTDPAHKEPELTYIADKKIFVWGGENGDPNLAEDQPYYRGVRVADGKVFWQPKGLERNEDEYYYWIETDKAYTLEPSPTNLTYGVCPKEPVTAWWIVDWNDPENPTLTVSTTKPDDYTPSQGGEDPVEEPKELKFELNETALVMNNAKDGDNEIETTKVLGTPIVQMGPKDVLRVQYGEDFYTAVVVPGQAVALTKDEAYANFTLGSKTYQNLNVTIDLVAMTIKVDVGAELKNVVNGELLELYNKGAGEKPATVYGVEAQKYTYYPEKQCFVYGGDTGLSNYTAVNGIVRLSNGKNWYALTDGSANKQYLSYNTPYQLKEQSAAFTAYATAAREKVWMLVDFSEATPTFMLCDYDPVVAWNTVVGGIPENIYSKDKGCVALTSPEAEPAGRTFTYYPEEQKFIYGGEGCFPNFFYAYSGQMKSYLVANFSDGTNWLVPEIADASRIMDLDTPYVLKPSVAKTDSYVRGSWKKNETWAIIDYSGDEPTLTFVNRDPMSKPIPYKYDVNGTAKDFNDNKDGTYGFTLDKVTPEDKIAIRNLAGESFTVSALTVGENVLAKADSNDATMSFADYVKNVSFTLAPETMTLTVAGKVYDPNAALEYYFKNTDNVFTYYPADKTYVLQTAELATSNQVVIFNEEGQYVKPLGTTDKATSNLHLWMEEQEAAPRPVFLNNGSYTGYLQQDKPAKAFLILNVSDPDNMTLLISTKNPYATEVKVLDPEFLHNDVVINATEGDDYAVIKIGNAAVYTGEHYNHTAVNVRYHQDFAQMNNFSYKTPQVVSFEEVNETMGHLTLNVPSAGVYTVNLKHSACDDADEAVETTANLRVRPTLTSLGMVINGREVTYNEDFMGYEVNFHPAELVDGYKALIEGSGSSAVWYSANAATISFKNIDENEQGDVKVYYMYYGDEPGYGDDDLLAFRPRRVVAEKTEDATVEELSAEGLTAHATEALDLSKAANSMILGVQVEHNGVLSEPTMLLLNDTANTTVGINGINAEESDALYYDLQGIQVVNPDKGLYIKVQNGKAVKVQL